MSIQGIKPLIVYAVALFLGVLTSLFSLISPLKEEIPELIKKPTPTPVLTEQTRELTAQEQATMSGSFIKEFEMLMSSQSGERR
ncbi:hypothetical protein MUP56_02300 [Patescibacteria group bacterium]|nr:hypothetical protein [Patescibacteria group bacterium]